MSGNMNITPEKAQEYIIDNDIQLDLIPFDIELVDDKLNELKSISEKLTLWHEEYYSSLLRITGVNKPYGAMTSILMRYQRIEKFGKNYNLITPIEIPQFLFEKHFKDSFNSIEYNYWFFEHEAKQGLEYLIIKENWKDKLETKSAKEQVIGRIKELNQLEESALNLVREGKVDFYNSILNTRIKEHKYQEEIQFLRLDEYYYQDNEFEEREQALNIYKQHFLLKDWLENELSSLNKGYKIFKQKKDEQWFINALEQMDAFEEDSLKFKNRSNVKAKALFDKAKDEKLIFKYGITLKSFAEYLVEKFDAKISDYSKLGDPTNHIPKAQELVKQYKDKKVSN